MIAAPGPGRSWRTRWTVVAHALDGRGARAGRSWRTRWTVVAHALDGRGARAGRSRRTAHGRPPIDRDHEIQGPAPIDRGRLGHFVGPP